MAEKHYRSVVKGITWRIIGTADTIFLSWLFTGEIESALKIGLAELVSKIILFYIHERVWLKAHFWRTEVQDPEKGTIWVDHHKRSLIKGISWRFFGTLDTIIWAALITGDYSKALKIGFTEVFTKVILYWIHERVWMKIKWGKEIA